MEMPHIARKTAVSVLTEKGLLKIMEHLFIAGFVKSTGSKTQDAFNGELKR